MGSFLIGLVLGAINWPWWAVPALVLPIYAMAAAKSCGWKIEVGLGCDLLGALAGAAAHLAVALAVWWVVRWLRRRASSGAGTPSPRL